MKQKVKDKSGGKMNERNISRLASHTFKTQLDI